MGSNLNGVFRGALSAVLVGTLMVPSTAAFAAPSGESATSPAKQEIANTALDDDSVQASASPEDDEVVTIVVELEQAQSGSSLFGMGAQESSDHQSYKDAIATLAREKSVKQGGSMLAQNASEIAVSDSGSRDYYNVIDGFTISAPKSLLGDIQAMDGVKNAFVSEAHEAPSPLSADPSLANARTIDMTGSADVSQTGKGQVIAIVDTGLLTSHDGFTGDLDDESVTLDEAKVDSIKSTLTAGGSDGVYVSEKIPFAYDYAMHDADVTDGYGHGTHVAGIAAANSGDVRGTAPDAQLVIMKVSSDQGLIYDDALLAALDDCAKFDLAAVNISIGSDGGFSGDAQDTLANAVNSLESTGAVVNVAAGNSYSSAQGNLSGKNLPYVADPDSGTISSPASAMQATAVASAENELGRSYFTTTDGDQVFWQYGIKQADNTKWKTLDDLPDGEWEIFDGEDGKNWIQYMSGFDSSKNQIVLIERGGESWGGDIMTFDYKLYRAEGCKAIIVYDNVDADVPPNAMMDGANTSWADRSNVAFATVTRADGLKLLELGKQGGKIVLKSGQATVPSENIPMSAFSSWGATPDLSLKPDITAPGGNIYSTTYDGAYGWMSGTSMAAPQMTGISAQMREYVESDAKFAGMSEEEKNDVVTQLLMSTAKPLLDTAVEGGYYSPRQQGSGLVNVENAVESDVFLTVDGAIDAAHPKAELGESSDGVWSFTVTLHNLGETAQTYTASTVALSDTIADGLFQQHSKNYANAGIDVSYSGLAGGKIPVPAKGTAS